LGERRYSSNSFLPSALEGGEWSASRPGRPLPPGKEPPIPTVQEAGWAPQQVWTYRVEGKCLYKVRCEWSKKSVIHNCECGRGEKNYSYKNILCNERIEPLKMVVLEL
jgi:hypothetical protein